MWLLPRRLNARIILKVSCILLASGIAFGWMTARDQTARLLEAMRLDSVIMAKNFAESCARHLLVQDYAELESFLLKSAELPDIRQLQVCEPDGTLIWNVERSPDGQPLAKSGIARLVPPSSRSAAITSENDMLVIWQPIVAGSMLGWLKADFSLATIHQAQANTWGNTLFLAMAWVAGSALLIVLILRPIVRSIGRLSDFSKQLDEHKGAQISVGNQPLEITELGESLNEASAKLLSTERQLLDEQQRLRESARNLSRANADLQRFAEVTAHHLQEPVRRMANYAERLTRQLGGRLDDAEARLSLEFIVQQARRQQALIRDVERYLAADQPRGKVESVDARQAVAGMLERSKDRISESSAEITLGNLPPCRIDLPRLYDVFSVALENALRHGRGEQSLRISIEGERQGSKVRYRVSDNGHGVEAQYRERVFRVFERLTSDDDDAGTGIGLAILRRVAESCDGCAWIEEAPGGGCCLLFELPMGELL